MHPVTPDWLKTVPCCRGKFPCPGYVAPAFPAGFTGYHEEGGIYFLWLGSKKRYVTKYVLNPSTGRWGVSDTSLAKLGKIKEERRKVGASSH